MSTIEINIICEKHVCLLLNFLKIHLLSFLNIINLFNYFTSDGQIEVYAKDYRQQWPSIYHGRGDWI